MPESNGSVIGRILQFKKRVEGRLEQGFYSEFRGYGLRRDLSESWTAPSPKIPAIVRPLESGDLKILLPIEGDIDPGEEQQIRWRRHFLKKIPHGCYVAIDGRDGRPCYMQWLVLPEYNDILAQFKCFPRLNENEALLEQAYTLPSHRGLGIMSFAMSEIAEKATKSGIRFVTTFVDVAGLASIKACQRAGFRMHLHQHRSQLGYGLIVRNKFVRIADDSQSGTQPELKLAA